jgi:hypothetical protein
MARHGNEPANADPVYQGGIKERIRLTRLGLGDAPGTGSLQPEHVQHGRVALVLEFRRVLQRVLAGRVQTGRDGHVLLAVDLKGHRRGIEARADIGLPKLGARMPSSWRMLGRVPVRTRRTVHAKPEADTDAATTTTESTGNTAQAK